MRKTAVLVSLMFGCALDQPLELGTTAGMSFEEFRASVPHESGTGYYVVDWDRVLESDDELLEFWGSLQQGALAIYNDGSDIKWNDAQKRNLTYCVGGSFGANKPAVVAAMQAATDGGWEKFADVNFTYLPGEDANCNAGNPNVVFDVNQVSGQPFLARSFFPNDVRQNRNVLVDTSSFDPQQTGNIPLANILGHELGHVLGFRHEHIRPEASAPQCAEDNQFRGLTTYDSASVMHYPQCNGTSATLAFTQRDREGVALVYGAPLANPAPMTQLTFPTDGQIVPPSFEVQASVVDTDLASAELRVDGATVQTLTQSPFTFQVTGLAVGDHVLELIGTDAQSQASQAIIHVTVQAAGGDGDGDGTGGGNGDGTGGGAPGEITGGCSTGGSGAGLGLGLVLLGLVRRRRG